jgi:hypothetical protein
MKDKNKEIEEKEKGGKKKEEENAEKKKNSLRNKINQRSEDRKKSVEKGTNETELLADLEN